MTTETIDKIIIVQMSSYRLQLWIQIKKTLPIVKTESHQEHGPNGWFVIIHITSLVALPFFSSIPPF